MQVGHDIGHYQNVIKDWGYCYCADCREIRYSTDMTATEKGIRCNKCQGYNLEAPGWVRCPYHKDSYVKCARSGKGIIRLQYGYACNDDCGFRKSKTQ